MKRSLLLLLFSIALLAKAQITFQKMYGGALAWSPPNYSVQQTSDNGYIIGGSAGSYNSTLYCCLIKTNEYGDTLWTKNYGSPGEFYQGFSSQQTFDGGYIIVGEKYNPGDTNYICLIKTNSIGDTSWTKSYVAGRWGNPYNVQQTNDSGYVIVCTIPDPSNGPEIVLIKIDALGNTAWIKFYGGTDLGDEDEGYSVQQTKDGGYIILGSNDVINYASYVIKTDAGGNLLWSTNFGSDDDFSPQNIIQTNDGGYMLFSNSNILTRMDIHGNILWSKFYDYNPIELRNGFVQQTSDSDYIIAGTSFDSSNFATACLMKINDTGEVIWTRSLADHTELVDQVFSVKQTSDGGFIVLALAGQQGNVIYLIKTDDNGNSGCNNPDLTLFMTQTFIDSVVIPSTIVNSESQPAISDNIVVSGESGTVATICLSTGINEKENMAVISIYPNPTAGIFYLHYSSTDEIARTEVFNYLGETIFYKTGKTEELDLSNAASGIYFYSISTKAGQIFSGKMVKE